MNERAGEREEGDATSIQAAAAAALFFPRSSESVSQLAEHHVGKAERAGCSCAGCLRGCVAFVPFRVRAKRTRTQVSDSSKFAGRFSGSYTGTTRSKYRGELKGLQILLSYSHAGPGRKAKQGQEEISRNQVQAF